MKGGRQIAAQRRLWKVESNEKPGSGAEPQKTPESPFLRALPSWGHLKSNALRKCDSHGKFGGGWPSGYPKTSSNFLRQFGIVNGWQVCINFEPKFYEKMQFLEALVEDLGCLLVNFGSKLYVKFDVCFQKSIALSTNSTRPLQNGKSNPHTLYST